MQRRGRQSRDRCFRSFRPLRPALRGSFRRLPPRLPAGEAPATNEPVHVTSPAPPPVRTLRRPVDQFSISDDRKRSFAGTEPAEPPQDRFWPFLADINTNVRVQQKARLHLKPLALLRSVTPALNLKIVRQTSQQIEGPGHGSVLLPQDDFFSPAEDLDFFALQPELFRQPHCLAVSRSKYLAPCP